MPFFDQVQRASWNSVEFPVDKIDVHGQARLAIHEYPHADGASLEPLGRKPYVIRMHMTFDENILTYANNYPGGLGQLRGYAETGTSAPLVIPNLGTIQAFCTTWGQSWNAMVRSGEGADYEWIEDQEVVNLDTFITGLSSTRAMDEQYNTLGAMVAAGQSPEIPTSAWQTLTNAYNAVQAARDQAGLVAQLVSAKILSLLDVLSSLDAMITSPLSWDVLEAIKQLRQSTVQFQQNLAQQISPPSTYNVPRLMSASDISRVLYGDATHAIDIIQINPVTDAYAIPAGTSIRYLPA